MCKGSYPLLLIRFKSEIDGDGHKRDCNENDANQIAQRHPPDEPQRKEHRNPNNHLAQIGLHQDEQAGRSSNGSRKQQAKHRMHFAELSQEQRRKSRARAWSRAKASFGRATFAEKASFCCAIPQVISGFITKSETITPNLLYSQKLDRLRTNLSTHTWRQIFVCTASRISRKRF